MKISYKIIIVCALLYSCQSETKVKEVNMLKKHKKPTKETKGGIVTKELYIHLSNLKQLDEGKTKTKDKKWHQG